MQSWLSQKGWISRRISVLVLLFGFAASIYGQRASSPSPSDSLQQHYDAAETLLSQNNLAQAESQFKLFLAEALHRVANGRAQLGQYADAAPLFEEALTFSPGRPTIKLDYAKAALDASDLPTAQRLAQSLVDIPSRTFSQTDLATVHWVLGEARLGMDDNKSARDQLIEAVALDPSFENQYSLGKAYLALLDPAGAAKLFAMMLKHFGDTAQIHMEFGLAYARADFPEQAIPEFKKALALDDKLPDAHYSLGASYLSRSGDTAFAEAQAEFHKELTIHPDDFFSYYELGHIAMNQHRMQEAVRDLTRAGELNPQSDDTFLMLGNLYGEMSKPADEQIALRKAIQVCTNPSKNHYQIRGAHYQLGLLLMRQGKTAEAKREMQIAESLLLQNRKLDAANLKGESILRYPERKSSRIADPAEAAELKQFEQRLGPAIADSFNNIGIIAAQNQQYVAADGYFQRAAQWNPEMQGLDYNWGRAAFGARNYRQAVICLSRYMQANPDDNRPRVPLGMSQFMLSDYKDAVRTLAPLGPQLDTLPLLSYAYADSLIKTGQVDEGIERLQRLESAHPNFEMAPAALGEVLLMQKQYDKAEAQLRTVLRINPANESAKYDLALALLALNRKDEAQELLMQLAQTGTKIPSVYYQLGKLQLDGGNTDGAIANLEIAARLAPDDRSVLAELKNAYSRKDTARRSGQGKYVMHSAPILQEHPDGSH